MTTFTLQDLHNELPTTPEEDALFKQMEEIGLKEAQLGEVLPNPDLPTIINNICAQLQLLATVISQAKAQPNTTPPEGTLQETVDLVLQNNDWLNARLADVMDNNYNIEELVREGMQDTAHSICDDYFTHNFNLHDHCDIDSIVRDVVEDRIEDAIRELFEEKMSNASVSIDFN